MFQIHALTDDVLVLDRGDEVHPVSEEDFQLPAAETEVRSASETEVRSAAETEIRSAAETEVRYRNKKIDPQTSGKSELCHSMRELRLPADMVDSKAW